MQHYGAEEASGIPESELLRANVEIHRYVTQDVDGPLLITVKDQAGEAVPLFTARESVHMADVRDVVQVLFTAQSVAVALLVALAVVMLVMWPPRALAAAAFYGSVLTVALFGIVGLVALSGFEGAWTQFHLVAFSNDLWQLNPSRDHLIQMFPEAFWRDITLLVAGSTLLEAVALSVISGVYVFVTRPHEEKRAPPEPRPAVHKPALEHRPHVPPNPRNFTH